LPITPSRNNISFFSTHLQGDVRMEGNPLRWAADGPPLVQNAC
jgi:hypothetical protein